MPRVELDGQTYVVRRRWAGSAVGDAPGRWKRVGSGMRRKLRPKRAIQETTKAEADDRRARWYDFLDVPVDDGWIFLAVLAILALVALVLFGVPVVVPLLAFLGELAWLLLLIPLVWMFRVLFRRPWTVEIVSPDRHPVAEWRVVGWKASGQAEAEIVRQLESGSPPAAVMLDEAERAR